MNKSKDNLELLLRENGRLNGRPFSEIEIECFLQYYQLVMKWNPRLHLTTLTTPESFFDRHLRESEFVETALLPNVKQVWDLGSGLGIPGIPLAILRNELPMTLVESKRHKAIFLEEVAATLNLKNLRVVNSRIESLETLPPFSCLTARAVEQMGALIPSMLKLGEDSIQILLLGSGQLIQVVKQQLHQPFDLDSLSLPNSQDRFLIRLTRST